MFERRLRLIAGMTMLLISDAGSAFAQTTTSSSVSRVPPATQSTARSAAELRALRDSLSRRFNAAREAFTAAQAQARAVPDTSMELQGAILRFRAENLAERERAALQRAFDRAADELDAIFGDGGRALMKQQVWLVTARNSASRNEPGIGLDALERVGDSFRAELATTASFALPLDVNEVVDVVRAQAGRRLVAGVPMMKAWLGGGFSIDDPTRIHYFAHRQLALHESSPARRCARGNIAACSDLTDPRARARWFDPTDIANFNRVPVSGIVRESLLRYAIEVDGPAVLRAFTSPTSAADSPVPFIAGAVGRRSEDYLRDWQAELSQSGAVRVKATPLRVLTAFGWFALCGVVATRRRAR
jgi:hypothetical protein